MKTLTAAAVAIAALGVAALPAAATPACEKTGSRALHAAEDLAGPAGTVVHRAEDAYCATPLP